jgi:flavin-dependent dehydrogenase
MVNADTVPESVDVVVVGSRIAGSAAAITLAHAGRRVLVLDRASFPSDTVSTHLLFPGGLAELQKLGALHSVLAEGAPPIPEIVLGAEGITATGTFSPVDGIDYGLCTRRPQLDMALVNTAREAGAELREKCRLTGLVWHGGRVAGVRYTDGEGAVHEVHAKLVIGADGRDSTVAELVGVATPYKTMSPGRGLAFFYCRDDKAVATGNPRLRGQMSQWRHGTGMGMYFPTNLDGGLILFMPPVPEIARFRKDQKGMYAEMIAACPELSARAEYTEIESKLRSADDTESYFRVSSGPGWALTGDAGHFKDPVIAQGIRDGLRYGRVLAEHAADALDSPALLDRRLREYERLRDAEVLPTFYWGQKHTRPRGVNSVELEAYKQAVKDPKFATAIADCFSRKVTPQQALPLRKALVWTWRALRRPGADYKEVAGAVADDLRLDAMLARDLLMVRLVGRPYGGAGNRWARDGWTPKVALGKHKVARAAKLTERQTLDAAA